MKSFESYCQLVILFWGPICINNTFYVIACSIPFVLLLFWSVLFEKLHCKHLRGSHLLTFLWISGADLYVTSRWPDTSVFHSLIPALVPRPKFITPSWLEPIYPKNFGCDDSVRPSIRPSVQTLGEGEGRPKTGNPTGGGGMQSFLVADINNMAAGSSYARLSMR